MSRVFPEEFRRDVVAVVGVVKRRGEDLHAVES